MTEILNVYNTDKIGQKETKFIFFDFPSMYKVAFSDPPYEIDIHFPAWHTSLEIPISKTVSFFKNPAKIAFNLLRWQLVRGP